MEIPDDTNGGRRVSTVPFVQAVFLVILVLAVALSGSRASAQLGKVPPPQLVVTAAAADATYISIEGVNFGSSPSVFLGGIPLEGVTVNGSRTQITALIIEAPDAEQR